MADPEAPEQTQDTPDTDEAPEGTPSEDSTPTADTGEHDWEHRYNDLRPEFDRTRQRLSQYEEFIGHLSDPETQAEALEALGLELEADEPENPDDGDDPYQKRLESIEQFISHQTEAQARQEEQQLLNQYISQELADLDPDDKFSDDYVDLLVRSAPEDEDGIPDLKESHKRLQEEFEREFKARIKSKQAPRAPSGASPSHQPNLDDPEERRDWMAQQLRAGQDQFV